MRRGARGALAAAALVLAGCAPARVPEPAPAPIEPLPPMSMIQPVLPAPAPLGPVDPLAELPPGPPVTLTAANEDIRVLLTALADIGGLNLAIDSEVTGRVSVSFTDVPVREALRLILEEADLGLFAGPPALPFGPVVFYPLPVNVNEASADLIHARWKVSEEMAEWIVRTRVVR